MRNGKSKEMRGREKCSMYVRVCACVCVCARVCVCVARGGKEKSAYDERQPERD